MEQREGLVKFQYITCYSLSFRWELHSVTVFLFQYITCYSLSLRVFSDLVRVLMFQYITCYSLSIELADKVLPKNRFNTSHVTLYLIPAHGIKRDVRFNTSHVTLYLEESEAMNSPEVFQYITCYSLSA